MRPENKNKNKDAVEKRSRQNICKIYAKYMQICLKIRCNIVNVAKNQKNKKNTCNLVNYVL